MEQLTTKVYTDAQVMNIMDNILMHFQRHNFIDQDILCSILKSEEPQSFNHAENCPVIDKSDMLERAAPEEFREDWEYDPYFHHSGTERY